MISDSHEEYTNEGMIYDYAYITVNVNNIRTLSQKVHHTPRLTLSRSVVTCLL